MSTKISVGIRMRPLLKKETDEKETSSLINIDEATNKIKYNKFMSHSIFTLYEIYIYIYIVYTMKE